MDSRRSELLEKYWATGTSIQEEQELKEIVMQFQEGRRRIESIIQLL